MRPPSHGDLIAAARALRSRPPALRRWALTRLMAEAEAAALHTSTLGGMHPLWGDGSLMAAALRHGDIADYGPKDADYCLCLALVAEALAEHARACGD